jgi:hypothetical protein
VLERNRARTALRSRDLTTMISSFKSLRSRRRPTGHNDLDPINRGSLTMVTPPWKHNVNEPQVLPWSLSHCMTRPGPPTRGNARETSLQILGIGLTVPQILNRSRVRERIKKDGEGLAAILDHFSIQKAGERKSRSKSRFQTTIYKEQDSLDDGMVYTLRSSLEPSSLFKSSTAAKINLSARRSRMMMMMMVEVTMKRGTGEKPTQTKRGKETGPPSEKTSCKPLITDHAEGEELCSLGIFSLALSDFHCTCGQVLSAHFARVDLPSPVRRETRTVTC